MHVENLLVFQIFQSYNICFDESPLVLRFPEKGQLAADEESPLERYYKPTFLQRPPTEITEDEGKLVRFDVKVTFLLNSDQKFFTIC